MVSLKGLRLSASQVQLFLNCQRAWAWKYIVGIETPPGPGAVFGTEVHKQLEIYYQGGSFDFTRESAYVASTALEHLPRQGTPGLQTEREFHFFGPSGHSYLGRIDIEFPGVVSDFKTTSDFKWQKKEEDLRTDPQAILYAVDYFRRNPFEPTVELRWIFLRTKGSRKSTVTKLRVSQTHVLEQFKTIEQTANEMAAVHAKLTTTTKNPLELPYRVEHCSAYGGCPHQGRCALSPLEKFHALAQQDKVISMEDVKTNTLLAQLHQNGAAGPAAAVSAMQGPPQMQQPAQMALPQQPYAPPAYAPPAYAPPAYAPLPGQQPVVQQPYPQSQHAPVPAAFSHQAMPGPAMMPGPAPVASNPLLDRLGSDRGMSPPEVAPGPAINPPEWQPPPPAPSPEAAQAATPGGRKRSPETVKKKILKLASGTPHEAKAYGYLAEAGDNLEVLLQIEAQLVAATAPAAPAATAPAAPAAAPQIAPQLAPQLAPPAAPTAAPQAAAPQFPTAPVAPQFPTVPGPVQTVYSNHSPQAAPSAPAPLMPAPAPMVPTPAAPVTAVPAKIIGVLYINCSPVNAPCVDALGVIAEAKSYLARGGVADWRYVEYGRGPGQLAEAVAAMLERTQGWDAIRIDTTTPEGQVALFEFQVRARLVVR